MPAKTVLFVLASVAIEMCTVHVRTTSSAAIIDHTFTDAGSPTTTNRPTQGVHIRANESVPLPIRCHCNLPECLANGHDTCTSQQGCFSELQPVLSDFPEHADCATNNNNNNNTTAPGPCFTTTARRSSDPTTVVAARSPAVPDVRASANEKFVLGDGRDDAHGSYGCLDMISVNKTCDEVLKSVDNDDSEFPTLQKLEIHTTTEDRIRVHHCCQNHMCNDRFRVAATDKAVQAALIAAFKNSMHQK